MATDELRKDIERYIDEKWDEVIADMEALIAIESVEDLDSATPNAPFGPGPRAALDKVLEIAARMGFATHDCEGYIGYADMPGETDEQIGIIGHVDVVPAGPGWTFPPYGVTRKDGYLIGRGVSDDKGPVLVALHAARFWLDRMAASGKRFPKTLRILFGANEETNMKDVAYYREHYADPSFLFTPDASFPVCYGEMGICSGTLTSAPVSDGVIESLEAGVAVNAVPGQAEAVLRPAAAPAAAPTAAPTAAPAAASAPEPAAALAGAEAVTVTRQGDSVLVHAQGKSAHASTPELGENAIDVLAGYLLANGVLAPDEQAFFELVRKVTSHSDGSGLGVAARDEHFGTLTAVGGMLWLDSGAIKLSIDFRYPTTMSAPAIERKVNEIAGQYGATFSMEHDKEPFLMDPGMPAVKAMLAAYEAATGEHVEPFTMKGGTYARMFETGVSFGPDRPWEEKPAWVGGMHGPDEGISEGLLKESFEIYVRTIGSLLRGNL